MADDFIKRAFAASAGGRAARFAGRDNARGGGFITVVSGLERKGLLFDERNKFIGNGLQTDLATANRRLADELAVLTADTMQENLRRPGVSSKRLYAALIDPKNRYSDQFGFGVGNPEWLDRSQAKYWRQIDQGFRGHLGREITGVWGSTLTGAYRTPLSGGTPYPVAGPGFSGFGQGSGGRLLPMGRKYALRLLRGQQGAGSRMGRNRFSAGTRGIISKPIEPEQYFKKAWEDFNIKGRYTATVREIISASFGGQGIPTKGEIAFRSGKPGARQPAPGKRFT